MKSIATVALTEMLSEGEIMAAGLGTSIIVMFLGMTNMITVIDGLIPKPVVRGLQIGLGLSMFAKAINMLPDETKLTWDVDSWMHWDGYLVGSVALLFCVITAKSRWCPTAFIMFLVGIIIASIRMGTANEVFEFGITKIHTVVPTASDWSRGLFLGTLPQVPTTLINSCIAVCKLSETLYPDRETGLNLRSVSTSVGMMNVGFCWFGGYPMCHGSGGLAGQHRFGARTNLSIIALGFCKLVLGIFFGKGLLGILNYFPAGLLASLLAVASWELSVSGREGLKGTIEEARLCVLTAALVTFYGQAIGIVMGIILAYTIMIADTIFGTSEEVQKGKVRVEKFKKDNAIFYNQCREWWIEQYNNPSFSAMLGHTGGAPPAPTAIKKVVYKKNDGVQKVPDLNTIKNTAV
jgi:MFS superfamily sulfate permease-like transporter